MTRFAFVCRCSRSTVQAVTRASPPQIMSRQSNLSKSAAVTGPPAEQDMPLDIPKKSKLSVEQVDKLKEQFGLNPDTMAS